MPRKKKSSTKKEENPYDTCEICGRKTDELWTCIMCGKLFCRNCGDIETKICKNCRGEMEEKREMAEGIEIETEF